jgi:hypothetical protein
MPQQIKVWIVSVARHWGVLMTSGVLIGAVGVWQGTGHRVAPTVYWAIAIVGLLGASFRAWIEEFSARMEREQVIQDQALQLADHKRTHLEAATLSVLTEQQLKAEIARLSALHVQPKLRFVPGRALFGTQECDALEIWNDGAAIDLQGLRQASYIELSFAFDPGDPKSTERNAAAAKARYGMNPSSVLASVLEERLNLNYVQELMRHPSNPLGLINNKDYDLSLQDEWDIKYVKDAWDEYLLPSAVRLGIAQRIGPSRMVVGEGYSNIAERSPRHAHIYYIPSYYYHRRVYESDGKGQGKLLSLYSWLDGKPGTNYTYEFARLAEELYDRFGLDNITVARRTFLQLTFVDALGLSNSIVYDVHPRDPWTAMTAKRIIEPLDLRMGFELDMRRITGESVLGFCSLPTTLRSLSGSRPDY